MSETVAILGASDKPQRFAHRAQLKLADHGHRVLPVNPKLDAVAGVETVPLAALPPRVDTVTVYLSEHHLLPLADTLAELAPRRVILNPGADSPAAVRALEERGLRVQQACTLVLLDSGRFEQPAA